MRSGPRSLQDVPELHVGRVLAVQEVSVGAQATRAAAINDLAVYVDDATTLPKKGKIIYAGNIVVYTDWVLDAAGDYKITTAALPAVIAVADHIDLYPRVVHRFATIREGKANPISARVRQSVKSYLRPGTRNSHTLEDAEAVMFRWEGREYEVVELLGRKNRITDDVFVAGKLIAPEQPETGTWWRTEIGDPTYPIRYWDGVAANAKFFIDNAGNVVLVGTVKTAIDGSGGERVVIAPGAQARIQFEYAPIAVAGEIALRADLGEGGLQIVAPSSGIAGRWPTIRLVSDAASRPYIEMDGQVWLRNRTVTPLAPASGIVLWSQVVSGKTRLLCRAPTGAVHVLFQEP